MTPPDQGGNELRLSKPEDAFALATNAAIEARAVLSSRPPFLFGVPVATKKPETVASEAVDAVGFDATLFPTIVGASNEWSRTAATIQAHNALDTATASLQPGLNDLMVASWWLLGFAVVVPIILIPMSAVHDITINPRPRTNLQQA